MVLAHIAIGTAGKRIHPRRSFWIFLLPAMLPDIIAIPSIIFSNKDTVPIFLSHGLFMSIVFSVFTGLLSFFVFKIKSIQTSLFIGILVLSHWLLDFISWPMAGRGLPLLFKDSPEVGLGMYSTILGAIIGEAVGLISLVLIVIWIRKVDLAKS